MKISFTITHDTGAIRLSQSDLNGRTVSVLDLDSSIFGDLFGVTMEAEETGENSHSNETAKPKRGTKKNGSAAAASNASPGEVIDKGEKEPAATTGKTMNLKTHPAPNKEGEDLLT